MSNLNAFLKPVEVEKKKDVVISKRFKDPDSGDYAKWTIRTITQDVNASLRKKHTKKEFKKGQWVESFDTQGYQRDIVLACVVVPDFRDVKLCEAWGTQDPAVVAERMLYPGEYLALIDTIMDLCGFTDEDNSADEQAKN